jgi:hypothetical protein
MRFTTICAILPVALAVGMPLPAAAQYCANYTDGEKSCGIPTLESCQQSISGVGGYCGPDQSAQIPDNLMQRWRQERDSSGQRFLHPPRPSEDQPGGLNWMPPPPGQ